MDGAGETPREETNDVRERCEMDWERVSVISGLLGTVIAVLSFLLSVLEKRQIIKPYLFSFFMLLLSIFVLT
jgi:hypothetical protein